jgi:DNA-binding transcriptional ArsR family regulator
VFRRLIEAGPAGLSVGRIAARVDVAPATLSFHLKELTNAGLVSARPEGRYIHYSANYESMDALLAFLTDNCCGGAPCTIAPAKARPRVRSRGARSDIRRRRATR